MHILHGMCRRMPQKSAEAMNKYHGSMKSVYVLLKFLVRPVGKNCHVQVSTPLYLFLIKRIDRFIMPLISGMAALPPRNNL